MAKMIGFSRNLKLAWLNKTIELMEVYGSSDEIKEQLNEYLKFEITSPTNLRKTREILMHIWVYDHPVSARIREKGLALARKYPKERLPIHWGMILSVFPVFMDMATVIGKLAEFEEEFTTAQIRQKLFDEWGERTTILHSSAKLLQTMKDFGTIDMVKTGRYQICRTKIRKPEVVAFLVYSLMNCENSSYRTVEQLNHFKCLFPFDYQVSREQIDRDEDFVYSTFGSDVTVALKERV